MRTGGCYHISANVADDTGEAGQENGTFYRSTCKFPLMLMVRRPYTMILALYPSVCSSGLVAGTQCAYLSYQFCFHCKTTSDFYSKLYVFVCVSL